MQILFQFRWSPPMGDINPNYEAIIINADVRGSGTYRGDFDMTGGIYTKQNWVVSDTPTFDINVWIESYGYPGAMIQIYI